MATPAIAAGGHNVLLVNEDQCSQCAGAVSQEGRKVFEVISRPGASRDICSGGR